MTKILATTAAGRKLRKHQHPSFLRGTFLLGRPFSIWAVFFLVLISIALLFVAEIISIVSEQEYALQLQSPAADARQRRRVLSLRQQQQQHQQVAEIGEDPNHPHQQHQEQRELDLQSFYQPRVTHAEGGISTRVYGSLSMPNGSPWCNGLPAYWLVGHEQPQDRPWCWHYNKAKAKEEAKTERKDWADAVTDTDNNNAEDTDARGKYEGGYWARDGPAVLDASDARNAADGIGVIDRHDCVKLDVNEDGLDDAVCLVGANQGTLVGYNELYLTQSDGSLTKVPSHGLQQYPTMRTRHVVKLRRAFDGSQLLFVTTNGVRREDGRTNAHRMFRTLRKPPYFTEVHGPWIRYYDAACVEVADVNGDGYDDLIVCEKNGPVKIYVQTRLGTFFELGAESSNGATNDWGSVRVADITQDGNPDLVVVGGRKESSYVRVFEGQRMPPYFDFDDEPYYSLALPYSTPDLELLDVNSDGIWDIYVVQADRSSPYCGSTSAREYLGMDVRPPPEWTPPLDLAHDVLLLGMGREHPRVPFKEIRMVHRRPGCGFKAERFGDLRTLLLAQGSPTRQGHNLLLEW